MSGAHKIINDPGHLRRRRRTERLFRWACAVCTWLSVALLVMMLCRILAQGLPMLDWQFLKGFPSRRPESAGVLAAISGSLWLITLTAVIAVPLGIGAAIHLEEYARRTRLNAFIELNIANLAGVPSIVYGILGLGVFVRFFHLGTSVLAGALTMAILILPVIIIAAREAIRALPQGYRSASYALGATKWQTTWNVVLPPSMPGVLTGVILAISRAIGEAAPLIIVGAATFITFTPRTPMDQYTALPILIYDWTSRPQADFQSLAAAGIIVLLAVLFTLNAAAIWLRTHFGRTQA